MPAKGSRSPARPAEGGAAAQGRPRQPAEGGVAARRRPSAARRRIGRYVEHGATEPTQQIPRHRLAGAGGFEPPYARAKVSCLTAWPRPTNRTGFPSRSALANAKSGWMAAGPESHCWRRSGVRVAGESARVKSRGAAGIADPTEDAGVGAPALKINRAGARTRPGPCGPERGASARSRTPPSPARSGTCA
jgi:hypothetical protein